MKPKLLGLALVGLMFAAAPANAMTLSVNGGTTIPFPGGFNPIGAPAVVLPANVTAFVNGDDGFGLELDSAATLRFEFFGSEAAASNTFSFGGVNFNNATPVGTSGTAAAGMGVIPFVFTRIVSGVSATNGGPIDLGLTLAFADLGDGSFLAMFGDGGGDSDLDDLVVRVSVSQVPLPAAVWLLLSAVLGLVSFARVRRNGPQPA